MKPLFESRYRINKVLYNVLHEQCSFIDIGNLERALKFRYYHMEGIDDFFTIEQVINMYSPCGTPIHHLLDNYLFIIDEVNQEVLDHYYINRSYRMTPENRNNVIPCLELMLKHGADPNARDTGGNTPLHLLFVSTTFSPRRKPNHSLEDKKRMAELLLEYGANCYIKNKEGRTAKQLAAEEGIELEIKKD